MAGGLAITGGLAAPRLVAQEAATANPATSSWLEGLNAWRASYERTLTAPDGWLTLIGLDWLKPGINSIGAAPDNKILIHAQAPGHIGLLTLSGNTVQLLAPAGGFPAGLTVGGKPAREGTLAIDNAHPAVIAWKGLSLAVLSRGDRYVVRIKDANAVARTGFRGVRWFAPDARFRVVARWTPYVPPQIEKIPTVLGTTLNLPAPGVAEFTLDGQTLRLEPVLDDPSGKTLFFILRDPTSASTTYAGGRFLHTGLPNHGLDKPGELLLDLNQLENPPCAYTDFATCPLPPAQNQLPVAIEAGEQRFTPADSQH